MGERGVEFAGGGEIETAALGVGNAEQLGGAGGGEVGVLADEMQLLERRGAVVEGDAERLLGADVVALEVGGEGGEYGCAGEELGASCGAGDGDDAGDVRAGLEGGGREDRHGLGDVEVLEGEAGLRVVVADELGGGGGLELGADELRVEAEEGGVALGVGHRR